MREQAPGEVFENPGIGIYVVLVLVDNRRASAGGAAPTLCYVLTPAGIRLFPAQELGGERRLA